MTPFGLGLILLVSTISQRRVSAVRADDDTPAAMPVRSLVLVLVLLLLLLPMHLGDLW